MRAGQILRSFLSRDTETLVRAFTTYVRHQYFLCQKCSQKDVVFSDISLMVILAGDHPQRERHSPPRDSRAKISSIISHNLF